MEHWMPWRSRVWERGIQLSSSITPDGNVTHWLLAKSKVTVLSESDAPYPSGKQCNSGRNQEELNLFGRHDETDDMLERERRVHQMSGLSSVLQHF